MRKYVKHVNTGSLVNMIINKVRAESIHLLQLNLDMLDGLLQNGMISAENMRKNYRRRNGNHHRN